MANALPASKRSFFLAAGLLAAVAVALAAFARAQSSQQAGATGGPGGSTNDLVAAIKATPGCLGTETATTSSKKQVIFAWFANKKAVLDWYWSDYHQSQMAVLQQAVAQGNPPDAAKKEGSGYESDREPLAHVSDDAGPILCIASLTPGGSQKIPGFPISITQISIELYQPLPGGIAVNGSFTPDAVKIPHMQHLPNIGEAIKR
jgi:hypothetical protein